MHGKWHKVCTAAYEWRRRTFFACHTHRVHGWLPTKGQQARSPVHRQCIVLSFGTRTPFGGMYRVPWVESEFNRIDAVLVMTICGQRGHGNRVLVRAEGMGRTQSSQGLRGCAGRKSCG